MKVIRKIFVLLTVSATLLFQLNAFAEDPERDWSTYEQDEKYIVTDDDPTIEEMERQKREAEEADRENPEVIGSEYGGMSPEEWFALLEAAQNSTVIYRDSDADGTPDEGYAPEGNWENVTVPDFVYDPSKDENYVAPDGTFILEASLQKEIMECTSGVKVDYINLETGDELSTTLVYYNAYKLKFLLAPADYEITAITVLDCPIEYEIDIDSYLFTVRPSASTVVKMQIGVKKDNKKTDAEKQNAEKLNTEKADTEKADTQKADTEKTDTENADTGKNNIEKGDVSNAPMAHNSTVEEKAGSTAPIAVACAAAVFLGGGAVLFLRHKRR